jgi:hypothetical protein
MDFEENLCYSSGEVHGLRMWDNDFSGFLIEGGLIP